MLLPAPLGRIPQRAITAGVIGLLAIGTASAQGGARPRTERPRWPLGHRRRRRLRLRDHVRQDGRDALRGRGHRQRGDPQGRLHPRRGCRAEHGHGGALQLPARHHDDRERNAHDPGNCLRRRRELKGRHADDHGEQRHGHAAARGPAAGDWRVDMAPGRISDPQRQRSRQPRTALIVGAAPQQHSEPHGPDGFAGHVLQLSVAELPKPRAILGELHGHDRRDHPVGLLEVGPRRGRRPGSGRCRVLVGPERLWLPVPRRRSDVADPGHRTRDSTRSA